MGSGDEGPSGVQGQSPGGGLGGEDLLKLNISFLYKLQEILCDAEHNKTITAPMKSSKKQYNANRQITGGNFLKLGGNSLKNALQRRLS